MKVSDFEFELSDGQITGQSASRLLGLVDHYRVQGYVPIEPRPNSIELAEDTSINLSLIAAVLYAEGVALNEELVQAYPVSDDEDVPQIIDVHGQPTGEDVVY